jgi:hypothetical protein
VVRTNSDKPADDVFKAPEPEEEEKQDTDSE